MDSGGHFTDEVYAFSRKMDMDWLIPIKGASQAGKPVANFPKTRNKKGIYLTLVGTDTAKEPTTSSIPQLLSEQLADNQARRFRQSLNISLC